MTHKLVEMLTSMTDVERERWLAVASPSELRAAVTRLAEEVVQLRGHLAAAVAVIEGELLDTAGAEAAGI